MKLRLLFLGSALITTALAAEPLTRDATVYARPDPGAPVLQVFPAGTLPTPAANLAEPTPEGWMAVEVPGPHDVFVPNRNVGKSLEVKPGSFLYLRPELTAPVVATMEATDKTDLAGLAGPRRDWSKYKLDKPITGYIKLATVVTAPNGPVASAVTAGPAPSSDVGRGPLPRFFEGRLAETQNFLTYRHPYRYQLLDAGGNRFAYLDFSHMSPAEEPAALLEKIVVIYGTARTINEKGTKRVIDVETLHVK
jgi:hypothetical protein